MIKNKAWKKLVDDPYHERPIMDVRRGTLASEYGDKIADYSKVPTISGSLLEPYSGSATHGLDVYEPVVSFLADHKCHKILDLGCGSGELLNFIGQAVPDAELHGATIHLGEVRYAREQFNLPYVVPMDMREISYYYDRRYFDAVVIWAALQFISSEERAIVASKALDLLKPKGFLIICDYYGHEDSKPPKNTYFLDSETFLKKRVKQGDMVIVRKNG